MRVIPPPHYVEETEKQRNLRLAAQWDTSCSFETGHNWKEEIKKYYGINQLVDSTGEPTEEDDINQADICEIIRAALAKNMLNVYRLNMQHLPDDWIDRIKCPGPEGRDGPHICAATQGSFFENSAWTIFLTPSTIKVKFKFNII
jgi:hypothetical protein